MLQISSQCHSTELSKIVFITDRCNDYVSAVQPDVLGLCEIFPTRQNDSLLNIPGYTSNFIHRRDVRRGGLGI